MSQEQADNKRARMEVTKNAGGLSKGLIKFGASLHKKKEVILANLCFKLPNILAVHHVKYGGVGEKLFLLPKEMEDTVTPDYNERGELIGITKDKIKIEGTNMKAVVMSWNAYKKNDAWMAYIGEDNRVICTFPRIRVVEVEVEVSIKGKKGKVNAWRTTILNSSTIMYASPKTIKGFLEMAFVEPEDFVRVAQSVEKAVVAGGFLQIDTDNFSDIEKLASNCVNTSLFKEARDLGGLLMGLQQRNATMEDKVKAFKETPSVAFATACKFFQTQTATLTNLTTKSDVQAVLLRSLDDDDNVLMGRVTINVDYWNKLTNFESIMVYKEAGNLAIKRKGKVQSTSQKFATEKAGHLKAILGAICDYNTRIIPEKSAVATQKDEYFDDQLFDD
jgi:hypothetical protein